MKSFDDDYPLAALRTALSDTVVAFVVAVLISVATGAAVALIAQWDWPSNRQDQWALLFLWIIHWGVAGVMLWGFPLILLQVWGLYRLLMTETKAARSPKALGLRARIAALSQRLRLEERRRSHKRRPA